MLNKERVIDVEENDEAIHAVQKVLPDIRWLATKLHEVNGDLEFKLDSLADQLNELVCDLVYENNEMQALQDEQDAD